MDNDDSSQKRREILKMLAASGGLSGLSQTASADSSSESPTTDAEIETDSDGPGVETESIDPCQATADEPTTFRWDVQEVEGEWAVIQSAWAVFINGELRGDRVLEGALEEFSIGGYEPDDRVFLYTAWEFMRFDNRIDPETIVIDRGYSAIVDGGVAPEIVEVSRSPNTPEAGESVQIDLVVSDPDELIERAKLIPTHISGLLDVENAGIVDEQDDGLIMDPVEVGEDETHFQYQLPPVLGPGGEFRYQIECDWSFRHWEGCEVEEQSLQPTYDGEFAGIDSTPDAIEYRIYVFDHVQDVAVVPVRPSDVESPQHDPDPTDFSQFPYTLETDVAYEEDHLHHHIRRKAAFVNDYYSRSIGSMGQHGFNFELVTRIDHPMIDSGWVTLPNEFEYYQDPDFGGPDRYFVEPEPLLGDVQDFILEDIPIQEYDTGFLLLPRIEGPAWWRGWIPPAELMEGLEWLSDLYADFVSELVIDQLEAYNEKIVDFLPVEELDWCLDTVEGNSWRHELGHAMGPDGTMGLTDIYAHDEMPTFGDTKGWGLMGRGSPHDALLSFDKLLGGQMTRPRSWLSMNLNRLSLLPQQVQSEPLLSKDVGDEVQFIEVPTEEQILFRTMEEVAEILDPSNDEEEVISLSELKPVFIVEPRVGHNEYSKSIVSPHHIELGGEDPEGDDEWERNVEDLGSVKNTPTEGVNGGVNVYRLMDITAVPADGNDEDDEDDNGINFEPYLIRRIAGADDPIQPTVEPGQSIEDGLTGVEFDVEDEESVDLGTETTTTVSRSLPSISTDTLPRITINASIIRQGHWLGSLYEDGQDRWEEFTDSMRGAITHPETAVPEVDLIVETPDGKRTGVDPETGEVLSEIEGSRVTFTGETPQVTIPQDTEATALLSVERYREAASVLVPDHVPVSIGMAFDTDPEIIVNDDVIEVEGRERYRVHGTVSPTNPQKVLEPCEAEVDPERITVNSAPGEFVTAYLTGFEDDVDLHEVDVSSCSLGHVPAVHDDRYGFVENPVVEIDGEEGLMVKFDREVVIDEFGPGMHYQVLKGVIGGVIFQGGAEFEVFDPSDQGEGRGPPDDIPGRGPGDRDGGDGAGSGRGPGDQPNT